MIILKYIFLILVFGCCCLMGVMISKKFKNRVIELKEFKNILNILEAKIKFTYEPLGDIFNEISLMTDEKSGISKVFKEAMQKMKTNDVTASWDEALESSKSFLSLNKEDINIIKGLGKLLRKNRC